MKLVISYDLIDKISEAKGELKLQRMIKKEIPSSCLWFGIYSGFNSITGLGNGIGGAITAAAIQTALVHAPRVLGEAIARKQRKELIKLLAEFELEGLSIQLHKMGIETSSDLLLDSEQDGKAEYKLMLNDDKMPIITQKKYIIVPTLDNRGINGGDKLAEITQEHQLGTKEYTLSLGSRSRSRALKPAFSNI